MASDSIDTYFAELDRLLRQASVLDRQGKPLTLDSAVTWAMERATRITTGGGKLVFVGNGGSAAIASHMAIDYSKNGGMRALAFNDGAALTCLGNDLGYDKVFSTQIDLHGRTNDLLVAISSSGQSPSILNAVQSARGRGMEVVTFSGFRADNPLRSLGDVNFFVDSESYGFVEIAHLTLIHAVLDRACSEGPRRVC